MGILIFLLIVLAIGAIPLGVIVFRGRKSK